MTDVNYRAAANEGGLENGNVLDFPNIMSGQLADLIAAASAPAQPDELGGDPRFGVPSGRSKILVGSPRRLRRSPAIAALAAVASLIVGSTSLAAATGVPAPAARIVDQALHHVDIDIHLPGANPGAPGTNPRCGEARGRAHLDRTRHPCDQRHAVRRHDSLAQQIGASSCSSPTRSQHAATA